MSIRRHFEKVSIVDGRHSKDAARLFTYLIQLVHPVVKKKKIFLKRIFELDYNDRNQLADGTDPSKILGIYICTLGAGHIEPGILGIHIKDHWMGGRWRDFADLTGTLLHELAHAYHHQIKRSSTMGHGHDFNKCALEIQQEYYNIYSRVRRPLSTFCPDGNTIRRMYKQKSKNSITKSVGMGTSPAKRVDITKNDWVIEFRQWCIERKLDSEGAAAQGKKLDHYHSKKRGPLLLQVQPQEEKKRGFFDTLRGMAKGLFANEPARLSLSSSSRGMYRDKDGFFGLNGHPKQKAFYKEVFGDVTKGSGSIVNNCGSGSIRKGTSTKIQGKMKDIDISTIDS